MKQIMKCSFFVFIDLMFEKAFKNHNKNARCTAQIQIITRALKLISYGSYWIKFELELIFKGRYSLICINDILRFISYFW